LIGLILASRFRFRFIEGAEELMAKLSDDITDAEFQLSCRQLIYDIQRMEHESSEFGMNSPDLFQQAFGPENHEIVNGFYEVWPPIRKDLFTIIKRWLEDPSAASRKNIREEVERFSNTVSPYSQRFLELCLQRYSSQLVEKARLIRDQPKRRGGL
jgi:hypothetical protein